MSDTLTSGRKPFAYGAGALIVLVFSVGVAAVVYSLVLPVDFLNIPAWIFGPLGIYTLSYSLVAGKNSTYFSVWGTAMIAVALIFGFYKLVSAFTILGFLAILIAFIGIIAYQRSRK